MIKRHHFANGSDDCVVGDHCIFHLEVLIHCGARDSRRDGNRAIGAIVNIGNVIVDDRLPLADDTNSTASVFVLAQKEVPLYQIVVSVAESQGTLRFAESVVAMDIFARLIGNDFYLTIHALKKVVFNSRKRVA